MSKTDYYSEEKTLAAPGSVPSKKPAAPLQPLNTTPAATALATPAVDKKMGGGDKMYGRELRDFDDKDIESLLSNLTTEELEDLNNDFDPDNSMLPPSQRCRDQTEKTPTGPFHRDKLLKHLEDTAKNEKDWEEVVPFSPGLKRGKVYTPKEPLGGGGFDFGNIGLPGDNNKAGGDAKSMGGMQMPIELDLDDDEDDDYDEDEGEDGENRVINDAKLERALDKAPERDLVDLAGILGMHNVLNQPQYYNALKGKCQDENTGATFNGIIKAYQPRIVPDEPENVTDVDDCIKRLEADDSSLEEVNINNMKRVSKERIRYLIKAASKSKHIKKLCMANTAITDAEARPLIDLLEESMSLKVINIESNFISPELLARMLKASLIRQSLVEFHAENQRASILGNQIEMDITMTVEESDSLLRVGVSLHSMEARHRVAEALERNYERLRLQRLEAKKGTTT